jgi:uncharacterized protein YgiB involved in biofilm formation
MGPTHLLIVVCLLRGALALEPQQQADEQAQCYQRENDCADDGAYEAARPVIAPAWATCP